MPAPCALEGEEKISTSPWGGGALGGSAFQPSPGRGTSWTQQPLVYQEGLRLGGNVS